MSSSGAVIKIVRNRQIQNYLRLSNLTSFLEAYGVHFQAPSLSGSTEQNLKVSKQTIKSFSSPALYQNLHFTLFCGKQVNLELLMTLTSNLTSFLESYGVLFQTCPLSEYMEQILKVSKQTMQPFSSPTLYKTLRFAYLKQWEIGKFRVFL